ncbi:type II toxin-antitoxin system PemK/MazF family toxin [Dolichospermum circinale]|uniref:type II toxin-antitoxin system PemK/MazF family toxin n=1 Tax=Dolichospermum circinale TaxID=109265 RepID=UPI002FEE2FF0
MLLLQTGKHIFHQISGHVKIEPNSINRLNKDSAIDTLQLRGVDLQRFIRKLGSISEITMLEIIASIVTVIEFEV